MLRNPFDRVVSEYTFRRRRLLGGGGEINPRLANLDNSFEDWVISTYQDSEFRTKNFFKSRNIPYSKQNMIGNCLLWFIPQTRWISSDNGELLVDEVLRFKSLMDD